MKFNFNSLSLFKEEIRKNSIFIWTFFYSQLFPTLFYKLNNFNNLKYEKKTLTFKFLEAPFSNTITFTLIFLGITLLTSLFFKQKSRFFLIGLLGLNIFFNSLELIVYINFSTQIDNNIIFSFFETNSSEAIEFIKTYFNFNLIILLLYYLTLYFTIFFNRKKNYFVSLILVLAIIFSLFKFAKIPGGVYFRKSHIVHNLIKNTINYKKEIKLLNNFNLNIEDSLKNLNILHNSKNSKNPVYIMVIGESFNKHHSSLYGYPRNTQPLLEKERKNGNLFVFNDVVSPHHVTKFSVEKMATTFAHDSKNKFTESYSVIDVMKKAGFKTYWIGNQNYSSSNSGGIKYIISRADTSKFSAQENLDEAIFPLLDEVLKEPVEKKFIILHLYGNHWRYEDRYPKNFTKFNLDSIEDFFTETQKQNYTKINDYDNSIFYNDFIINSIIEKIKNLNSDSFLLYLSDHGETLAEKETFFGHLENSRRKIEVEIPFMIWTSPYYKKNNPEKINLIEKSLNRPYSSEDTIYTILDLSSVDFLQNKPEKSVINNLFTPKKRIISSEGDNYDQQI